MLLTTVMPARWAALSNDEPGSSARLIPDGVSRLPKS
jgi:hypothetical protein